MSITSFICFNELHQARARRHSIRAVAFLVLSTLLVLLGVSIYNYLVATDNLQNAKDSWNARLHLTYPRISVEYTAANQTSGEIFCKLRSDGYDKTTVERVVVNGIEASTRDSLPVTLEGFLDYKTIVFRYDGPWEGTAMITIEGDTGTLSMWPDLSVVCNNPIAGAYVSADGMEQAYHERQQYAADFQNAYLQNLERQGMAEIAIATSLPATIILFLLFLGSAIIFDYASEFGGRLLIICLIILFCAVLVCLFGAFGWGRQEGLYSYLYYFS